MGASFLWRQWGRAWNLVLFQLLCFNTLEFDDIIYIKRDLENYLKIWKSASKFKIISNKIKLEIERGWNSKQILQI